MPTGDSIRFGPFRFDPQNRTLWRDGTPVALRPRTAQVLKFLLERPAQLLSRQEIIHGVWRGGHVTGNALRVCLHEIRQALDDPPQVARYLETEGRDGYRFVGLLPHLPTEGSKTIMVGRQRELDTLTACFARAARGSRQLVLIHGEAGTGKTTLVNHFLARVRQQEEVLILRGQGIETSGQGEALQPLLDALESLVTVQDGTQLTQLRRRAPGWLSLLPHLASPETMRPSTPLLSNTRLGRELSGLLETLGDRAPVLLVLEDLHWSDAATLEILNILLQRAATARLLILGSLRPGAIRTLLPTLSMLRERLQNPGVGTEINLAAFSRQEVEEYARRRLNDRVTPQLLELLFQRASGHPLFTGDLLDFLLDAGLLHHGSKGWSSDGNSTGDYLPGRTQHLIDLQLERLPTEQQQLLAVASVVGVQFSTRIPASCLELPVEIVEQHCEMLARHHHLLEERDPRRIPGEGLSGVYRFRHDVYRQVCYRRLGQIQRVRLHQRVGELLEHDYAAGETSAGELAHHFGQGQHWQRAVRYRLVAAEVALARAAPREVVFHCEHGLEELHRRHDPLADHGDELTLLVHLIIARTQMEGHASTKVAATLERAAALAGIAGSTWQRARVLWGQYIYHTAGQNPAGGKPALKRLLAFARERRQPMLRMVAQHALGGYLFYQRTRLDWALQAFETALTLHDPHRDRDLPLLFGQDARVLCLGNSAWISALRGDFHGARQRCEAALAHAQQLEHPYSLALARIFTLNTCVECDTPAGVETAIDALQELATQHGFVFLSRICDLIRLLNAARQNQRVDWQAGIELFAQSQRGGAQLHQVGWWFLIDILFHAGRLDECQHQLSGYIPWCHQTGQNLYLAEGYRLQGRLLRHRAPTNRDAAAGYFQQALGLARRQRNRLFELRAALDLARLQEDSGRSDRAYQLLAGLRDLLMGDCQHPTLQEVRMLLETLEYPRLSASC